MAEAQLAGILRALSGTLGNFIFRTTKNGIVVSDRPGPRNTPPTAEQLLAQAYFSTASKQWRALTPAQRTAWNQYAQTYFPTDKDGTGTGPAGQAIYLKAAWYQQAVGLPLPGAAPGTPPPPSPTAITLQSATNTDELRIAVTHPLTSFAGYRLFVEITAVLPSPARNPQPGDFRAVRGLLPASFPALLASNASYTFTPIRYPLEENDRFGCRASIISPGGIPSNPFQTILLQDIT